MKHVLFALAIVPVLAAQSATPVLYAVTDAGIQRSSDLGRTWMRASEGPDSGERMYAAVEGQLQTSTDSGRTWTTIATPFPVAVVAVDPFSSNRLYISATHNYDRTFATTTNRGESWQTSSLRAFPFITVDPTTPGRLYASMGGLIESKDYGVTWRDVGPAPGDLFGVLPDGAHFASVRRVTAAAADPERPGDVHACIEARWVQMEDPSDVLSNVSASGIVNGWASYVAGLWAAGQLPGDQPCTAVVRVSSEDATLYAAGSRVYRRTGLLSRRVELVADLGSPIRSLVVGQR